MIHLNDNFLKLPESYLFSEITRRVNTYKADNPDAKVISLGIGDVTRPLVPAVADALHKAVDEMSSAAMFRGYGPEQGYGFLREAIVDNDFAPRGVALDPDEVFVGDGAKSDLGNIGDLFGHECRVAITDPVYPVYIDTNVMGGRAGELQSDGRWSDIVYLQCTADNGFVPALPVKRSDIIYLCYPNNPTGTTLTKAELKNWVDYARENESLILFDAAYEAFIRDEDVPHSIYEIEGAKEVAIEFRSFSKTAGFTGLRCGYTVVPKALKIGNAGRLNRLWNRRQSTKFNGTAYIIQRAAEAVYTLEGQAQIKTNIDYYMDNAAIILQGLTEVGVEVYGGRNAPYVWMKTPEDTDSWSFFSHLLSQCQIVGTPGTGFGPHGEGFLRLSAFGTHEHTVEAMRRIAQWDFFSKKMNIFK